MTICNVFIGRDRALIGTDSLAAFMEQGKDLLPESERRNRHTSKFWLYPHASMVLSGRGDVMLAAMVRLHMDLASVRDFDHAVKLMPEILAGSYQAAMAQRKQSTGVEMFPGADIILVGRSPSMLRFEGWRWSRRAEDAGFTASRIDTWLDLPEVHNIERVVLPNTPERMEALARAQMAWANENYPGMCGGNLIIAELTLGAIDVRTIANLDLRQALPAASLPSPQNSRDGHLFSYNREKPAGGH
jgi:hypothetical protein